MLTVQPIDPAEAIAILSDVPLAGMPPPQWDWFRIHAGLLAFTAEEDGATVGFALAESHPKVVHILNLEGDTTACGLLLERLVMFAGERDMSGWFPAGRSDLLEMTEKKGFKRQANDDVDGRLSQLYRWERNMDEV